MTKVRRFRLPPLWPFESAVEYEVRTLLLGDGDDVRETVLHRTRADFDALTTALRTECRDAPATLRAVRRAESDARADRRRDRDVPWYDLLAAAQRDVDALDRTLRVLTSDGVACNGRATRAFLALRDKRVVRRRLSPDRGETADDLVRRWLWEEDATEDRTPTTTWIRYWAGATLRRTRPEWWAAAAAVAWAWWSSETTDEGGAGTSDGPTRVSLRKDALTTLLVVVFFAGRRTVKGDATRRTVRDTTRRPRDETKRDAARDETKGDAASEPAVSDDDDDEDDADPVLERLTSPLPLWPANGGQSCWSEPRTDLFRVRGATYLADRVKIPSSPALFPCLGVDLWLRDQGPRPAIFEHPAALGGRLPSVQEDLVVINFLLPFGNLAAYCSAPPSSGLPPHAARVWSRFRDGDDRHRDARLKLLPVVVDGPWVVRRAVGPGTAPAVLGRVVPLVYHDRPKVFGIDVNVSSSRIARTILNVVRRHTESLTIAFALFAEAVEEEELPETVLCSFQLHEINVDRCPTLPDDDNDEPRPREDRKSVV